MSTPGIGPKTPDPTIQVRAAFVEGPDLIKGLSKSILGPSTKATQDYTQNVKGYAEDVSDRVVWMRGGGKKGGGTRATTTADILARRSPMNNPRNPAAIIPLHKGRVTPGHRH